MIQILASRRLRVSKLPVTSGDHCCLQRYHQLTNARSCIMIFFLIYRPTCQTQLNYDLLSSWAGEGSAMVPHSRGGDAQRTLLEGTCPAATQSWSPSLAQSPGKQIALPAAWFNPAHSPACPNLQEVQVSALTASLRNSLRSFIYTALGFNCEEKEQLCRHPSMCTYDYISKGYSREPAAFHSQTLLYPTSWDFCTTCSAVF